MGYPVITRLGISQFWYNHWYSDTNFFFNSKQDKNLLTLFKVYINYGVSIPTNLFLHEYFFNKKYKNIRKSSYFKNWKFFRKVFFSCESLEIEHTYFTRKKNSEFFPMRLWLIRYSKWLILSFSCFRPIKSKYNKARHLMKKETHSISPSFTSSANLKRIKFIYLYLKRLFTYNYRYNF